MGYEAEMLLENFNCIFGLCPALLLHKVNPIAFQLFKIPLWLFKVRQNNEEFRKIYSHGYFNFGVNPVDYVFSSGFAEIHGFNEFDLQTGIRTRFSK